MGAYNYLVFGTGRQGTAAIHDLIVHCEAARVVAIDPDARRGAAASARLKKILGKRASAIRVKREATDADFAEASAVLSCAPYSANVELTRRSLKAGVPFCDLGGNPATVSAQEKMAKGTGIAVVPDCGVSPGLSNIIAVHFAKTHNADTIRVRCGGLPLIAPDEATNPLRYKLVFSPWGLISEYSGGVPVICGGRLASVEALGTIERFDDGLEASPTSNNSPQVVDWLRKCGVKDYNYMTLRYDGHWRLVQGWKTLGYLQGDEARDTELARFLSTDKALNYDPAKDRDRLILAVRATKDDTGVRRAWEYKLDVAADTRTRFSAMELTTSWGGTIVAHHMVSGRGKPNGFATPERFVDTGWVISEVEKRLALVQGT